MQSSGQIIFPVEVQSSDLTRRRQTGTVDGGPDLFWVQEIRAYRVVMRSKALSIHYTYTHTSIGMQFKLSG